MILLCLQKSTAKQSLDFLRYTIAPFATGSQYLHPTEIPRDFFWAPRQRRNKSWQNILITRLHRPWMWWSYPPNNNPLRQESRWYFHKSLQSLERPSVCKIDLQWISYRATSYEMSGMTLWCIGVSFLWNPTEFDFNLELISGYNWFLQMSYSSKDSHLGFYP